MTAGGRTPEEPLLRWPPLRPLTLVVVVLAAAGLMVRVVSSAPLGSSAARWFLLVVVMVAAVLQVGVLRWRWPQDRGRSRLTWTLLTVAALILYAAQLAAVLDPERAGWWFDVGYFAGSPFFAVALLILPAPPVRDAWEASVDLLQGLAAALAITVATLWLLPVDLEDGLNFQEGAHIAAVSGTVGVLVFVVMRQRRPGGIALRQLEYVIVAAAQVTAAAVLGFRFDVLGTDWLAVAASLLFVSGCVTGAQAVGRRVVEAQGPHELWRREMWAVLLPGLALGLGLGSIAVFAVTPDPVTAALGAPMVVLILVIVLAVLALFLLSGQEARRLRASAAERELQAVVQERWFQSLAGESGEATVMIDLGGRVIFATPSAAELLGSSGRTLLGIELDRLLEIDTEPWQLALADAAHDPELPVTCPARAPAATPDEPPVELELTLTLLTDGGGLQAYVVGLHDLHRTERITEAVRLTDAITGLPNRMGFLREGARVMQEAAPDRSALVVLDLARFGLVNDTLGHDAGDALLREVAGVVDACAASGGRLVGRVGGDEFAVLMAPEPLDGEDPAATGWLDGRVLDAVEQLRRTLEPLSDLRGDGLPMTCHVGYCVRGSPGQTADELLRRAELAAEQARRADITFPVRFDPDLHARRMADVGLEADLRQTLRTGGLHLHYQPIVDLATGRPLGLEALVRWDHPTLGALRPDQFVGLAERAGLSDDLTRWVLDSALTDHAALEQAAGRTLLIAVNVGPPSVTAELPPLVRDGLARHGVRPERLVVEVTETALFTREADAEAVLQELRDGGVSVALDDFGTGYSSLSLLARMPVDELKVDRSFVSRLEDAGDELALVRGVLQLCRTLRLTSVAEGVENETQAELLLAMGADLAQGYLYAPPLPKDLACAWLRERGSARDLDPAPRSVRRRPQAGGR